MARRMRRISTHVLDIARGVPAQDIPVQLEDRTYDAFAAALDTVLGLDDARLLELRDIVMSGAKRKDLSARILHLYRELAQS